tara:strand:+ start:1640 stop:2038 length:399 start_codon:yes stop_codon:yes gene_type:complete
MSEEFNVYGMSVPRISELIGTIMVLWGIIIYILTEMSSLTSLIPSFVGLPIVLAGLLVRKLPEKRSLFMHISSTFGLISVLGGLMAFKGVMSNDWSMSTISQLFLLIIGGLYLVICVKSFIHAKKMREAAEN